MNIMKMEKRIQEASKKKNPKIKMYHVENRIRAEIQVQHLSPSTPKIENFMFKKPAKIPHSTIKISEETNLQ